MPDRTRGLRRRTGAPARGYPSSSGAWLVHVGSRDAEVLRRDGRRPRWPHAGRGCFGVLSSTTCRSSAAKECGTDANACPTDGARLFWSTRCVSFSLNESGTQDLDPRSARSRGRASWSSVTRCAGNVSRSPIGRSSSRRTRCQPRWVRGGCREEAGRRYARSSCLRPRRGGRAGGLEARTQGAQHPELRCSAGVGWTDACVVRCRNTLSPED